MELCNTGSIMDPRPALSWKKQKQESLFSPRKMRNLLYSQLVPGPTRTARVVQVAIISDDVNVLLNSASVVDLSCGFFIVPSTFFTLFYF